MTKFNTALRGFALSASMFALVATTPAFAEGKADRARAAIAEASGKVDAADKLGTAGELPRMQAQAQAALRAAKESLASGHKEDAIAAANHASELADMALGEAQKRHTDQQINAETAAADANARANAAEQAAAAASADAAAARAQPPVVVAAAPTPAPTTTVTTETVKQASSAPAPRVVKKVVTHRPATRAASRASTTEKTTTTVTTTPNG